MTICHEFGMARNVWLVEIIINISQLKLFSSVCIITLHYVVYILNVNPTKSISCNDYATD